MTQTQRIVLTLILSFAFAAPAFAGDVVVQLGAGDGFVVEDSTATEQVRIDENGDFFKNGSRLLLARDSLTTSNTFVGMNAGNLTMTGTENTAVGEGALDSNATGSDNAALGTGALSSSMAICCRTSSRSPMTTS